METDCAYCYNIIYNSVSLSLHAYLGEIAESGADVYKRQVFPSPEDKEWFLPLNLGNKPSVEYLFYARAVDVERDRCIDLLYEVPVDGADDSPLLDEDGEIIWNCMAYDAGLGWTLITERCV